MEERIKELEALVLLLDSRIKALEKKANISVSVGLSDKQHLEQLKKDAKSNFKNL